MGANFKYIVIGIICCLCIIFFFQLFWLNGLYTSIEDETKKQVLECIKKADQMELQTRLDSLNMLPDQGKMISITKDFSSRNELGSNLLEDITRKQIIADNDTATVISKKEKNLTIDAIDALLSEFKVIVHQVMDSIAPVNINKLDSLLILNFKENNIYAKPLRIIYTSLKNDSVIISKINSSKTANNAVLFIYEYDPAKQLGYKIYTEPLVKTVLQQMSGILITTGFIIIILCFAFRYLIRTVLRQKTLEQMKDDFTNNMTHELKTPIAVAYSAADALLNFKQGDNKEKREKYLTICEEQLSELNELVEQILSMSMEQRQTFILNKENVSISSMVNNLITRHKLKSDKDVTFNTTIEPENLTIYADRIHLNNILSNLIDNAIKYSGNKTTVDIRIYEQKEFCVFEIKDNGQGIPIEKQAYIFDKFYRITYGNKYNVKGYGLGLFYVKTMTEKHNGRISINSAVNKGSTFTVKIPRQ